MFCIPLSGFDELNDIQKNLLDSFFETFLPNGYVTVSKAVEFTGMQEKIIIDTFAKLYLCGFLDVIYAVRCPECGQLIKEIKNVEYFNFRDLNYCYACNEPIEITNNDVVTLFVRKEKSPFMKGQHLGNGLIVKSNVGVAQNDGVKYLREISESFANIVDLYTNRFNSENKNQKIKEKAYKRYKHNKKVYNSVSVFFKICSFLILIYVIWISRFEKNVSGLITIIIYVFQNIIDVILKSTIVTDLNEIERDAMFLESKNNI